MKKIIIIIILTLILVGCDTDKANTKIKVLVPYGSTLIAIGQLLDLDDVSIEVVSGPNLLMSAMTSETHDVIIAPLNLGTSLYISKGSNYKLESILTIGNSYIVSRENVQLDSMYDLEDKDILAYGQSAVPDIILKSALILNDISSTITYQASADQVIPFFICNTENINDLSCNPPKYILSTEPMISKIEIEYKTELNILDLQELLKDEVTVVPQAAIFINADSRKLSKINSLIEKIQLNVHTLNENPTLYASNIINKHSYFKNLTEEVIAKSIPRSNITYIKASENKQIIIDFYTYLNYHNSNILGGKTPDEGFYN